MVEAAGIDPSTLSAHGQRILDWLAGLDDPTIEGICELLTATRNAAQIDGHRELVNRKLAALRDSGARLDAAAARYDEK